MDTSLMAVLAAPCPTCAGEGLSMIGPAEAPYVAALRCRYCDTVINGANALIHAQMRRSPFQLTKDED